MNASIDPYLRACILISFFSVKWTTLITGQSVIHFAKLKLKELTNRTCKRNAPQTRFGSFWGRDELKFWFKQFIITDSDQFPNTRSVQIQ